MWHWHKWLTDKLNGLQHVSNNHRLEHVQLEVSIASSDGDSHVVAHYLSTDHRQRFALGRVYLAWKVNYSLYSDYVKKLCLFADGRLFLHSFLSGDWSLTRHDGWSGFVLGEEKLANSATWSRRQHSDIVNDLHERDGEHV